MPKLNFETAGPSRINLNIPQASPNAYGAQGFEGLSHFGQTLMQVDEHLQNSEDQLRLVKMASDYKTGLTQIAQDAIQEPDELTRKQQYLERADKLRQDILDQNPNLRPHVEGAFNAQVHADYNQGSLHVAAEARKLQVGRAIADFSNTEDKLVDTAALSTDPNEAAKSLATANELRDNMLRSGMIDAVAAAKSKEAAQNRYWTVRAQQFPEEILAMQQSQLQAEQAGEDGSHIAGMDQAKFNQYVNLAVSTLHARQASADQVLKQQEAQVKATKEQNAALLTADILEGKNVSTQLPALLRSRGLDDGVARTLAELQTKMTNAPDMRNYERGLASQIDASLTVLKFSPQALQDGLEQGIVSDFIGGKITKDEFTHLMGVYRGVLEYKQQQGKEGKNLDVNHAHSNLVRSLTTAGPADKYDALTGQTITDAEQYYWRRMGENPNADPWKVMSEAEKIFKPVIEKRLGISKPDQQVLEDARMKALAQRKAISPATYKAYQDKSQSDRGRQILQDAMKALPPPPEPGFFERFQGMLKKKDTKPTDRPQPGVMGGE